MREISRWRASAIHLSFSVFVALVVTALILLVWYPGLYYRASGADHLFFVLMSVDVVVGPILTLILYRHGKPGLMFDLSTILILQLGALLYGISVIVGSRPVFLVAAIDRFVVVAANQIDPKDMPDAPGNPYRALSFTGPQLVGFALPDNLSERDAVLFDELSGKRAEARPKLYRPYAEVTTDLLARAHPVSVLLGRPEPTASAARAWVSQSGRAPDDLRWLPLQARKMDLVMFIDPKTAEPLGMLEVDPW